MVLRRGVAVVLGGALLASATACSSSSSSTPPTSPPTTLHVSEKAALEFRAVVAIVPYAAQAGMGDNASCHDGKIVTPPNSVAAAKQVVLADPKQTKCYALGPTLLTGRAIESAQAFASQDTAAWEVAVHFGTDAFVTKVARPEVGKQVAIVLDGVVQSAPMINQGITGRNVTISGEFSEAEAKALALRLS